MIEISSYINIPVAIALWGIGFIIKHYIPFINNKIIPIILILSGIGISFVFEGVTKESFIIGLATALVSIGAHSSGKQLFQLNGSSISEDDETEIEEDSSDEEEPMG